MKCKDKRVLNVIEEYKERSSIGVRTYGKTLEQQIVDGTRCKKMFLQDLKEELMDAVLYIDTLQELERIASSKE